MSTDCTYFKLTITVMMGFDLEPAGSLAARPAQLCQPHRQIHDFGNVWLDQFYGLTEAQTIHTNPATSLVGADE
eukprot:scaffold56481_cov17-Tisochrysis_lutea.AAC.1